MSEEPSAKDIRRLRALENRLDKSQQTTKELREERNSLRRQVRSADVKTARFEQLIEEQQAAYATLRAETETTIQELRAEMERVRSAFDDSETLEARITALIEENRLLSTQLEDCNRDRQQFEKAVQEASGEAERERTLLTSRFQKQIDSLESEKRQLETQNRTLALQLQEQGKLELIQPENVASLLGGLLNQISSGIPGMNVVDGEIKLKVGFGRVGEHSGFVIPAADSAPEIKESLHEVTMRFNTLIAGQVKPEQ